METKQLAILDRIAHNLPVMTGSLQTGHVPTKHGDIYLAWGRAGNQQWHGVAAFRWNKRMVAVTSEHGWGLSSDQVRQRMLDYASINAEMFVKRGLHSDGAFGGLA